MTRTHAVSRALLFTAFAGVAVVGFGACSNDSSKLNVEELSTSGATLPGGADIPGGVDIPGLDDCQQVYASYILALTAAYTPGAQINFDQTFGDVQNFLPEDLHDDLGILVTAYRTYSEVLAANNNDMSAPAVQQAVQELQTPELSQATDSIDAYFEATCPGVT